LQRLHHDPVQVKLDRFSVRQPSLYMLRIFKLVSANYTSLRLIQHILPFFKTAHHNSSGTKTHQFPSSSHLNIIYPIFARPKIIILLLSSPQSSRSSFYTQHSSNVAPIPKTTFHIQYYISPILSWYHSFQCFKLVFVYSFFAYSCWCLPLLLYRSPVFLLFVFKLLAPVGLRVFAYHISLQSK